MDIANNIKALRALRILIGDVKKRENVILDKEIMHYGYIPIRGRMKCKYLMYCIILDIRTPHISVTALARRMT